MSINTNTNNPPEDIQQAKKDIEKRTKKAESAIDSAFKLKSSLRRDNEAHSERGMVTFTEDVSRSLLKRPIEEIKKELFGILNNVKSWEEFLKSSDRAKYQELIGQLDKRAEVITAYLNNAGDGQIRMTEKGLAKVGAQAEEISKIMMSKNPDLIAALAWSLNTSDDGKILESGVQTHFKTLKNYLQTGQDYEKQSAYLILSFLKDDLRKKFAGELLADEKDPLKKKAILEDLNAHGVLSHLDMENLLEKGSIKPEEMEKYYTNWMQNHEHAKFAQNLLKIPYGAESDFSKIANYGTALKLFVALYLAGTAFGNLVEQDWKNDWKGSLKGLFKNPFLIGSLGGLYMMGSNKDIFDLIKSGKTQQAEKLFNNRETFADMDPAWKSFLEESDGLTALSSYIKDNVKDSKLPKEALDQNKFIEYMLNKDSAPETKGTYKPAIEKFTQLIQSKKVDQKSFEKYAQTFFDLGIYGDPAPQIYKDQMLKATAKN